MNGLDGVVVPKRVEVVEKHEQEIALTIRAQIQKLIRLIAITAAALDLGGLGHHVKT